MKDASEASAVEAPAPGSPAAVPEPLVCVVVLTWNGRDDTLACAESVLAQDYPRFRLLVVDNASSDGTEAALRQRHGTRLDIIRNDSNLLYAGGMNVGLHEALRQRSDFALLLNNDTILEPGLLAALVGRAVADQRLAAVGPKIYYHANPERLWFAGGELRLWRGWPRHRGLREPDLGQYDRSMEVDYLTGCALLLRTSVLAEVGFLDTGYAMYAEDADWCLRARARGYRLAYEPAARLWHKVSASAGPRSLYKIRRRWTSQMRLLRRHARWYHWSTIPFFTVLEVLRVGWGLLWRRV